MTMRIITGKYKGRLIHMPKGIRPTQNKVRKAVFDILGDIEGLSFLELFAGSGAIGFEALSRGAREVIMVESNRECIGALNKNIGYLKALSCAVLPQEAERAIGEFARRKKKFDIIFLDPPYYKETADRLAMHPGLSEGQVSRPLRDVPSSTAKKTLQTLGACDILAPCGFAVVQHHKRDQLPPESGELVLIKGYKYGDTLLSLYARKDKVCVR